jgi:hypothetical protein
MICFSLRLNFSSAYFRVNKVCTPEARQERDMLRDIMM